MAKKFAALLSASLLLAACGGARSQANDFPPPPPLPDSVEWNADIELAPLLRRADFGVRELNASERVDAYLGAPEMDRRLGLIAEDSSNPAVVRINALQLLAHRKAVGQLFAFTAGLRSPEERVRMAAVSAMRDFLPVAEATAVAILERALRDPNPRIQTRALELLSDRDVDVLREFLPYAANQELRDVARDLIQVAESRGAALIPRDTLGTLEQLTESGMTITFRPAQRWPEWDAAVGELSVTVPKKQRVVIANDVEVVGNVIPAFALGDSALVYETNREIHVRSLRDGADRKLADGIAPRIMPFTGDIIFFRRAEERTLPTPTDMPARYHVLRVSPAGGEESTLGEVKATAKNAVKGNYSPVRWSRIREMNGSFYIIGETMGEFGLPDPFGR